jgi:hypothetical protein
LKVGRFEPEYLGKLVFYLEALDREVRKFHEHPAICMLLCASKDVVFSINSFINKWLVKTMPDMARVI